LLEAGPADAALGFTARVRGITLAKWKPKLEQREDLLRTADPRAVLFEALAPGGMSNHWACAVPRFSPDDFADAERAGVTYTWPLGYSDLVPWYQMVEPWLQIAGAAHDVPNLPCGIVSTRRDLGTDWSQVTVAVGQVGRDVVPMPYAYGQGTFLTKSATAFNAFTRLVAPIEAGRGLEVRYDARVLRLEWSALEHRVSAVICEGERGGPEVRIPCRAVVLAAGAVNTAQILLESQSKEWPEGIGNARGLVGAYLHDHPLAKLVVRLGRPLSVAPASYITRPRLSASDPLYAAAFMQWGDVKTRAKTLLTAHPGKAETLGFSVFGTMIPTHEDRISLIPGARPGRRSRIAYALRYPEKAIQTLERAREELLTILSEAGLSPTVEVFRIEAPGTSVHYGGTCRMHESPDHGVVDARSRVFGASNVAAADSSVFTTGPEKNPVLTAMALSARAASLLADDLHAGKT